MKAARHRSFRLRNAKSAASDNSPADVISDNPKPMYRHVVPSANTASVMTAAATPHRKPANTFVTWNANNAIESRQAPSQYISPTLESPKQTCSTPTIHR